MPLRNTPDRTQFFQQFPQGGIAAEIGVFVGRNAATMYEVLRPAKLVLVDPWVKAALYNAAEQERNYCAVLEWAADKPGVQVIRQSSHAASLLFADGYFDHVYIDAAHDFINVLCDVYYWYPKVKVGGWLSGHDYSQSDARYKTGVKRAVDLIADIHGLAVQTWHQPGADDSSLDNFFLQVTSTPLNLYAKEAILSADVAQTAQVQRAHKPMRVPRIRKRRGSRIRIVRRVVRKVRHKQ